MNSIILCEGETDQILISYYFIEHFRFKHCKKLPPIAPKKLSKQNDAEKICYYHRENDNLIIWAVGGHDDIFEKALQKVLNQNKIDSPTNGNYSRICIVTDHDSEKELSDFWGRINKCLAGYGVQDGFQEAKWTSTLQNTDFDKSLPINLLGLPVPLTENGALETLLLNALEEDCGKAYIVKKSREFVRHFLKNTDEFSEEYLSKRREKIKAPLAVFLAITVPERTFDGTDKMLRSIPWDNYQAIKELFAPFDAFMEEERQPQ